MFGTSSNVITHQFATGITTIHVILSGSQLAVAQQNAKVLGLPFGSKLEISQDGSFENW
jgi:hypothetical protein